MGADFIVACVPLKYRKGGSTYFPSKKTIKDVVNKFVPTEKEFNAFMEEFQNRADSSGCDEMHETDKLRFFRSQAIDTINTMVACYGRRDTCTLHFKKFSLLISGGESWGDAPTDSYDMIADFTNLPYRLQKQLGVVDA